jgi:hypothetical protein
MIKRRSDWDVRLSEYLASVRREPFCYGSHDCALHSANAVLAMTGTDIAAAFRGRYSTAQGSVLALARYGAGTLDATVDAILPAIPPSHARRGDLVWTGEALGVCDGTTGLFVGQEGEAEGLVTIPRSAWRKAWRV